MKRFILFLQLVVFCFLFRGLASGQDSAWRFNFRGALPQWKDGLPVGNGQIGAQSWGTGRQLFLTLDRGDVWDLRYEPNRNPRFTYAHLRELVREGNHEGLQAEMSPDISPTADETPFHLGMGRLEIDLPEDTTVERAELDMHRAEVRWDLIVGGRPVRFRVFACAGANVIVATLDGDLREAPKISFTTTPEMQPERATKLGYKQPTRGDEQGVHWVVQPIPESGKAAVVWRTDAPRPGHWEFLLTIPSQHEADTVQAGRATLEAAERIGLVGLLAGHREWWRARWARSSVHLPSPDLERLWINGIYKLASSSHGSVPANLQGLWAADEAFPAPWRGDYHCDMNVQETYWLAYSSNQLDLAAPLNRWLLDVLAPEAERFTKRFFGVEGLMASAMYDVRGRGIGGIRENWATAEYWLGGGGWLAQHLWWYYRYSMDKDFLRRAYPFMKQCLQFYEGILEKGEDGRLHIPLSISPEYFGNELEAWTPDPTADLSIVRNLTRYCIAAADALGVDEADRARWKLLETNLAPYPARAQAAGQTLSGPLMVPLGLKIQPNTDYSHSHRHPIHLFPIFPGGDLSVEGSAADRALIDHSIHNWILQGTGEWTGWSFPYGSMIASRVRNSNQALNYLEIYAKAFIWPNGFHVNGDYKRFGFTWIDYQPFTMEAECGFTAAVNEMLLQSWGGKIRIFPAVPDEWRNVSFKNLRAEGGVLVSGAILHGKIVSATIESEKGGDVKVEWPMGSIAPGQAFEVRTFRLKPGEQVELLP